jgi:tetratricopeptide (TPR) repeat protein
MSATSRFVVVVLYGASLAGCVSPADRHNTRGVALFNTGQIEGARGEFLEATAADPVNADAFYNLGSTYHRLGNTAEAERNYLHCLALNPNHSKAHHAFTVMLLEQKRVNEAFEFTQNWVDRSPGQPDPLIEMAWLERQAGRTEQSQQILHQVIAANPKHPRALTELATIYEGNQESERALALYQRALAADPNQTAIAGKVADLRNSNGESTAVAANPFSPPDPARASRDMRFQLR